MNEEKYIQFDHYLQNEMTVEERNLFESRLLNDEALAAEFNTFKEVQFQLDSKFGIEEEREAFKQNLSRIADDHFNKNKTKVISLQPWYYAAAASVALLFGLFFFNQNSNPEFADYNHPEQAYFTERGNTVLELKQAEDAFNSRNYKTAIPLFETILKENKTTEIQYFYGISLLEENQFVKAETVFKELKSGTSVYKNKATWSLALSKLKQKDYKDCKEILLTIPSDFEHYDQVEKLLKELD
ncbi:tetratricopeptide repeat protein [Flavobacterium sp.]|uniref:tetratricopeptide repeat protein n=1 Tax=Flavobacterium sp. TaxID=239 RepID=UPI0032659A40